MATPRTMPASQWMQGQVHFHSRLCSTIAVLMLTFGSSKLSLNRQVRARAFATAVDDAADALPV